MGFPGGSDGRESTCNAGDLGLIPGQEDPWRREWQLTPVFLPGWATAHGSQTAGHDYTQSTVYVALGHVSDMGML